jgi:phage-related protein
MYTVIFYEKISGESELWDFLEKLRIKSAKSKDARIQYNQITLYIQLLQNNGTMLPDKITKHLEENIWELRPGNNRIFYFYYENDAFVLLHQFRKKSQKTPRREIDKAKAERDDYLARKENKTL